MLTLGVETFAWRNFRGKRNARNFVHFAWINFRGWTQHENFAWINFRGWTKQENLKLLKFTKLDRIDYFLEYLLIILLSKIATAFLIFTLYDSDISKISI